jgi:hypothetical protein
MSAWQPIETAPKGGGAEMTTDPAWVDPPRILLQFDKGEISVGYWDWYYAEGGDGYDPRYLAWIEPISGERLDEHVGKPTHWMPLPDPPVNEVEQP